MAATSITGPLVLGLGNGTTGWIIGSFFTAFYIPIINGSSQAIWQSKVAPDVQGRVFAVRRMIAQIAAPLAMLICGPLADHVFEPVMMPGGNLVLYFQDLVGIGPGAGMALMFVLTGFLGGIVALAGYLFPSVRNVENILPDHEAVPVVL
jgi:hypothetical protein